MSDELILNETELLLLAEQMEANVSGVGFSLQLADVDTADFRGSEEGNIFEAPPVAETDRTGWIRKLKFYVPSPDAAEQDTNILLHVYRDGHIRCERYVPPELMDDVVVEIERIKQYQSYLQPINFLVDEFLDRQFRGQPQSIREDFQSSVNREFFELVETYLSNTLSDQQLRLYVSIVANIGVKLCEGGVPQTSTFSDVTGTAQDSFAVEDDEHIEEFFKYYANWVHNERSIDYSELVDHIDHILNRPGTSSSGRNSTPLEMVEYVIDQYDLTT